MELNYCGLGQGGDGGTTGKFLHDATFISCAHYSFSSKHYHFSISGSRCFKHALFSKLLKRAVVRQLTTSV